MRPPARPRAVHNCSGESANNNNNNLNLQNIMLETIAILMVLFWLLGMISSYTMGGFIHLLLVIAVIAILVRLIQGRRI